MTRKEYSEILELNAFYNVVKTFETVAGILEG